MAAIAAEDSEQSARQNKRELTVGEVLRMQAQEGEQRRIAQVRKQLKAQKDQIVLRKYPWGTWTLCFLSLVGLAYMYYHFTFGREYGVLFGDRYTEK